MTTEHLFRAAAIARIATALARVGLQPGLIAQITTGPLAFVLSLACLVATWRQPAT